jgi:hypothetical protein
MRHLMMVPGLVLVVSAWLVPVAQAQAPTTPAVPGHDRRMESLAVIGPGLLHEHMEGMIKQLSAAVKQMAAMVGAERMDAERMKRVGMFMADVADMLGEMPAIEARGRETPDLAMRDLSVMMSRLADLLRQMADLASALR